MVLGWPRNFATSRTPTPPGGAGDASVPTVRSILGVPLHSVPDAAIPPGVVWSVSRVRVAVVLRQGADLVVSDQAFFTSDSVGIRATMRAGFGFPHEEAITKITAGSSS
jgi:HK97 family phage major capsid protein